MKRPLPSHPDSASRAVEPPSPRSGAARPTIAATLLAVSLLVAGLGCSGDGGAAPAPTFRVTLAPILDTIDVGDSTLFTASIVSSDASSTAGIPLLWRSTNPSVATVNASGRVRGVAAGGSAIIAATAGGAADTAGVVVVTPPPALPSVRISEFHYDNVGTDVNEAIEVEGPAGTDLAGWTIVLYNGNGGAPYDTLELTGVLANQCGGRGTAWTWAPGLQNGAPDGMALVHPRDSVVEFLTYEGSFAATSGVALGVVPSAVPVSQEPAPAVGQSLHRDASGVWSLRATSLGYCTGTTPPTTNVVSFSGRTNSDPALPVGFEDQLFATLRSGTTGDVIGTTFTWSSDTPTIATVDQRGVVRAVGAGTAIIRATAGDGTTSTYPTRTRVAIAGTSPLYAGNTEFGDPWDGDPADEIIIRRPEYTSSFDTSRGIPNWVSYALELSHFGGEDRCDCFTYDPELPAAGRYSTADYTGAGSAAGYGIDRGHLARSADRTGGPLDNARTFYFSNIIPQASDNNQGPWAALETYLADLAAAGGKEVYIITGASGAKGTVKGEGRITIPSTVWKVALVVPRDTRLAGITSAADVQVVAVVMPNDAGIRAVAWQTYRTTIDAVEALSGRDLLRLLPDAIETELEARVP
ncbi:MAG: DNA/RNA non-specific endonuclease [Gemmatimonadota bacterium]